MSSAEVRQCSHSLCMCDVGARGHCQTIINRASTRYDDTKLEKYKSQKDGRKTCQHYCWRKWKWKFFFLKGKFIGVMVFFSDVNALRRKTLVQVLLSLPNGDLTPLGCVKNSQPPFTVYIPSACPREWGGSPETTLRKKAWKQTVVCVIPVSEHRGTLRAR